MTRAISRAGRVPPGSGEAVRPGQPDRHARHRAGQGVGVGHVVCGVAEIGQNPASGTAEALPDGLEIRQQLAGVESVGEGVDLGYGVAAAANSATRASAVERHHDRV